MRCDQCLKEVVQPESFGGCGYGKKPNGDIVCYECCHINDVAILKSRTPMSVYLSCDKTKVTNWPGGELGKVVHCHPIKNNMMRRKDEYLAFNVLDVHGKMWYGRGQPGMVCTIRPQVSK